MDRTFNLPQAHRGTVTMFNDDGFPFMEPKACKDWIHDGLTHFFFPRYAKLWHIENHMTSKPNVDYPAFAFYCSLKSVRKNAKKFASMMNQIEDMMGIDGRTITCYSGTGEGKNSAPFIAMAPKFWIRSPVAVSAYLTFIRLSPYMRIGEPFDDFVKRQLDNAATHVDAGYMRMADRAGNLKGLLARSLPCLNREGFSDYLLSCHTRGFACYNSEADASQPMDEESLIALRVQGRKSEMERLKDVPYRRQA